MKRNGKLKAKSLHQSGKLAAHKLNGSWSCLVNLALNLVLTNSERLIGNAVRFCLCVKASFQDELMIYNDFIKWKADKSDSEVIPHWGIGENKLEIPVKIEFEFTEVEEVETIWSSMN